jgi:hypothetical protein
MRQLVILNFCFATGMPVLSGGCDLLLQPSKSSIYSTKPVGKTQSEHILKIALFIYFMIH